MEELLRVLILEKNPQEAMRFVRHLERAGYKPDWVHVQSLDEFTQAIAEEPNLVLAGDLPDPYSAQEALDILKDSGRQIPLFVISNDFTEEMEARWTKQGAEGYLSRGRLERLGPAVRQALENQDLHHTDPLILTGSDLPRHSPDQREMEVIVSVNAALRNLPNRKMMLPVIAEIIGQIVPTDGVLICLKEPISGAIQTVHLSGGWQAFPNFNVELAESEIKTLFEDGSARWWEIPTQSPELTITPPGIPLGSLVCLPLTSSQENIGLIWFGCEQTCPKESYQLAQVVANIAATAIHRSTLNENTLRALQESEALANISRILNQNLDLDRIFRQIIQEAIGIIGDAYRAVIHLYDEKNQRLHAVALGEMQEGEIEPASLIRIRVSPNNEFDFGVLDEEDILSASMYSGKGVAGKVIELGRPMIVGDTLQDQFFLQTGLETEARSMVVAPILSGDRRLGTLSVMGSVPNLFSITDQNLLEKLCLQVSIAIENARLLEAERQQRELAQTQAEISALLNQTLSMDEVLAGIINYTLRFFGAKSANIMLVQEDQLEVVRQIGYDAASFEPLKIKELPEDDLLRRAFETGRTITVLDTQKDPEGSKKTGFDGLGSFVIIPLKVGKQVIGLLNVDSEVPNAFGQLELDQLDVLANSASVAVNNAQLYQVLEQSLQTEKSTRLQLIRADKLAGMGRMVASVAHELNNPLQTIKNCLFLIEQSFQEEDADLLELALSEVERLTSIVNRLQDVYRPVNFNEFHQVELLTMFADLEMLLETHLRRHSVQLKMQKNGIENVQVRAIPDQLKQVFLNLSLNGIEAMQPDGGVLGINVKPDQEAQRVGILFSDTGPGIPEEELKLIFDPFYTTKATGMGLGLLICYDIVQNHNGMIEVKNNKGRGVTFTVWLPMQLED